MEQKAFELIQEKLQAALNEQGFGEAVALETDNGRGVMFTTGEVAYGLFYETKQRRFVLRSATMKTPKEPGDWRQLSMWLFDEGENTMQDAESIANEMNPDYREVLYLTYFEGMSYAQAAEVTGKTVKQITNMVYRGKESLRRLLEREGITNAES